jgi:hypothetical protein
LTDISDVIVQIPFTPQARAAMKRMQLAPPTENSVNVFLFLYLFFHLKFDLFQEFSINIFIFEFTQQTVPMCAYYIANGTFDVSGTTMIGSPEDEFVSCRFH